MNDRVELRAVFRKAVVAALGVLAVIMSAAAVYAVRDIIVRALVALFIAVSLDPAVRWLTGKGMHRSAAVGLIFAIAVLTVAGLVMAVVPPLVRQATELAADLPRYIDEMTVRSRSLRELGERYGLTEGLRNLAATLPERIGNSVIGFLRQFVSALFTTLIVMVLTIYFMADLPRLRAGLVRLFPGPRRARAHRMVDLVVDKVGAYMIGNLLISLVAGVVTFLALTALGVPFAVPLAVVVAITDLIPMIGATLGAAICVIVSALSTDLWPTTVVVLIFFLVYQQLENYLIAPRILRNSVDLPALAVILAGLIGATVLGLVGALMAIPIAAVIKVLGSPVIREMDAAESSPAGTDTTPQPPKPGRAPDQAVPDRPPQHHLPQHHLPQHHPPQRPGSGRTPEWPRPGWTPERPG